MQNQKTKSSSSNNTSSTTESKKKNSNSNSNGIDPEKYRANIEEINSKNLNSPDMLQASVNNIIHPEDSVIYYPKCSHLVSNRYPVYPLRLKEEILKNFADDTLFFMYFEQPNTMSKDMAKKELTLRGWMFNTSNKNFYKLKGEPKEKTKDYIEGNFDCFEVKEWKIKDANNFKLILKE